MLLRLFGLLLLALALAGLPAAAAIQNNQLGSTGASLMCSGYPHIDVRCYGAVGNGVADDTSALNTAFTDALTIPGGAPIFFPVGTYKVTTKLNWDYAGIAANGLQIISQGATIDGSTIGSGNVLQLSCSGGTPGSPVDCAHLKIAGTLTVKGSTTAYVFVLGKTDLSDRHSGAKLDHLVVANASSNAAAGGAQLNLVANADLWIEGSSAGGAASVGGLALEAVSDSRVAGTFSALGASAKGLILENGASQGNAFHALRFLTGTDTCLSITSANAKKNAFIAPDFANCTHPVNANVGNDNTIIAPTGFGSNSPLSGAVSVVGRGNLSRYSEPAAASYTPAGQDDGLILSSKNGSGAASGWAAASLPVTLPDPAAVGPNWTMGFVNDNAKAIVLTTSAGNLLAGGRSLSTLTLGPGNYEFLTLVSDGTNFRVENLSARSRRMNGLDTGGHPVSRVEQVGGPGYQLTQADNGQLISSALVGSALAVTLPSTTDIVQGWTIGLAPSANKNITLTVNGVSGGHILLPRGDTLTSYLIPGNRVHFVSLMFDGADFRVTGDTSDLFYNESAYTLSNTNFHDTPVAEARLFDVLGSDSSPSTSQSPVAIFQKYQGSTATNGAIDATLVALMHKKTDTNNAHGAALFAGIDDWYGWNGSDAGAFSEAAHFECVLRATAVNGFCFGMVSAVTELVGATSTELINLELWVTRNSVNASDANYNNPGMAAAILVDFAGTKKSHAAIDINPFTGQQGLWGIHAADIVSTSTPTISEAVVRAEGHVPWTVDGTLCAAGSCAVGVPNNTAFYGKTPGGALVALAAVWNDGEIHLGYFPGGSALHLASSTNVIKLDGDAFMRNAGVLWGYSNAAVAMPIATVSAANKLLLGSSASYVDVELGATGVPAKILGSVFMVDIGLSPGSFLPVCINNSTGELKRGNPGC